jgi:type IV pilus assembly protein PilW
MEMKREKQHILFRFSNQGFTMVELLVAMVVSLLALAAIYSTFLAQHRSYQVQEEAADMQQNIRAAMYYMQREIRMAGDNPFKSLPLSNFGIIPINGHTGAGRNSITFTEDVNSGGTPPGNPSIGSPDGFLTGDNENITYALSGTNLQRTDNTVVPPNPQTVAQNIDALDLVYLDANSNVIAFDVTGFVPAANINQIRSVEITIVARTNDQLLYGTKNNNVYRNQQGTQIYAANDNRSRRILTAKIYCRNLDL